MSTLFDLAGVTRWTGSRALARLESCPYCHTKPRPSNSWVELPLFAHGGYGEAQRTTITECECRLTRYETIESTNPRPYR